MELQTAIAATVLPEGVIGPCRTILKRFGYSTRPFESYAPMRRPKTPLTRLRSEILPLFGGGAGGARRSAGAGHRYRPLLARQWPSRRAAIHGRSRSRPCGRARGFRGAAFVHPIAGN